MALAQIKSVEHTAFEASEQMQQLFGAFSDAMTDRMVERAATTAGNMLEVVDHMSEPDTQEAIHSALDELTALHRAGGLVALFEMLHFLNAMRSASTDSIVERGAIFIEHMVNNLATEEIATLASNATEAMHEATEEATAKRHKGGLLETMRLLAKPETQASIDFLLTFARKLQERA